jgi:hypothetical protein
MLDLQRMMRVAQTHVTAMAVVGMLDLRICVLAIKDSLGTTVKQVG